jgi:hypothetical protein
MTTGDDQTVGTETDGGRNVTVVVGYVTAGTYHVFGYVVGRTVSETITTPGDDGIVTNVVTDVGKTDVSTTTGLDHDGGIEIVVPKNEMVAIGAHVQYPGVVGSFKQWHVGIDGI